MNATFTTLFLEEVKITQYIKICDFFLSFSEVVILRFHFTKLDFLFMLKEPSETISTDT